MTTFLISEGGGEDIFFVPVGHCRLRLMSFCIQGVLQATVEC